MRYNTLTSFQDFLVYIEDIEMIGYDINLFRGQSTDEKLLPQICRENPKIDTTDIEIKMLEDFKRRSPLLINRKFESDWE